jgi:hypothetical protein
LAMGVGQVVEASTVEFSRQAVQWRRRGVRRGASWRLEPLPPRASREDFAPAVDIRWGVAAMARQRCNVDRRNPRAEALENGDVAVNFLPWGEVLVDGNATSGFPRRVRHMWTGT